MMLNSIKILIRHFESEIKLEIDKIKENIIASGHEFHVIRTQPHITDEDEAQGFTIANRLLAMSMDIIIHEQTLDALKILDKTMYPEDHPEEHSV